MSKTRALKPGILHLVDRVLQVYTPAVLLIAALAVMGWLVGSWLGTGHVDVERAVFAGLSVLVMGIPAPSGSRRRCRSCAAPGWLPPKAS